MLLKNCFFNLSNYNRSLIYLFRLKVVLNINLCIFVFKSLVLKNLFLAVLSGLLFSLGWPTNGYPVFLFFAFVPLLLLSENYIKNKSQKHFFLICIYSFFYMESFKNLVDS